jgi:hypothetical protein
MLLFVINYLFAKSKDYHYSQIDFRDQRETTNNGHIDVRDQRETTNNGHIHMITTMTAPKDIFFKTLKLNGCSIMT